MTVTIEREAATPFSHRYATQARQRARALNALLLVTGFIVGLPLFLWLGTGGYQHFTSLSGTLTGLGIASGLVGTVGVIIMLWLAARVPFIDRTIGHDHALDLHSRFGQSVFVALLLHATLLVIGSAASDKLTVTAELMALMTIKDFALAVAALLLLTVVAATSILTVKRKLAHEAWHGIHLLSYAAVLLSLPHQYSMSGLFTGAGFWLWTGMFVSTFFVLLMYRLFLPIFASLEHKLVVSRIIREAPDVITIEMIGRNVQLLGTKAGQFFHWRFLTPSLWWHQHPFSVSTTPSPTMLRITVRALGIGTRQLINELQPGVKVAIEGPYGRFSDAARTVPGVVLVGIGIGIAPIRALLEQTEFHPGDATVILRCSESDKVFLQSEIEDLCRHKGARLLVLTGHRRHRRDGSCNWLPAEYQAQTLPDLARLDNADIFVCGPPQVAEQVLAEARAAGVPENRLHNELLVW